MISDYVQQQREKNGPKPLTKAADIKLDGPAWTVVNNGGINWEWFSVWEIRPNEEGNVDLELIHNDRFHKYDDFQGASNRPAYTGFARRCASSRTSDAWGWSGASIEDTHASISIPGVKKEWREAGSWASVPHSYLDISYQMSYPGSVYIFGKWVNCGQRFGRGL